MLSLKRLFQIILIILTISISFMLVNISNGSTSTLQVTNNYDFELYYGDNAIPNNLQSVLYYVISTEDSTSSKKISDNIGSSLTTMGLDYINKEFIKEDDLVHKPILLFCDAKVSECIDLKLLVDYIKNGGLVMFAGGIPENLNDSYLYPIWGIVEKGNLTAENIFHIVSDFLPYEEIDVDYSGYNASTNVKVTDDVKVLIKGNNNPIVYSRVYKNGKIVVINGTFMENKNSGGIFSGALGELSGQLVYPIIGTKTVFLDGLSVMNEYDDKVISKMYGRSSVSFIRDVLWPAFLENSLLYELKYTATIKVNSDDDYKKALSDERQLTYLLNKITRSNGEIILRGDYNSKYDIGTLSFAEFKNIINRLYPNYRFHGYGIRNGKPSDKLLDVIKENFTSVSILNGVFYGNESKEVVQNFEYKNDNVHFPIISSGYTKDNGTNFNFISGLSLMGAVSHSFDIEEITVPQSYDKSWDALKDDFFDLNKDFFGKTTWLEAATISESAKSTKAYSLLDVKIMYEEDRVIIYCDKFMKGQKFYLRTNKKIKDIEGGTMDKINEVYYCIQGEKSKITVFYE